MQLDQTKARWRELITNADVDKWNTNYLIILKNNENEFHAEIGCLQGLKDKKDIELIEGWWNKKEKGRSAFSFFCIKAKYNIFQPSTD